ncbi:integrase core domain-containing protein [Hyphococcus sp.]|uniref:integrase core domain-containing protein n=1 Tax=Hyphococcus sp. TaxID=2038636 RepID=UPI003CCC0662
MIREMSLANPLWGAPRIHGELKMLGIGVAQSTIAKYMIKHRGPPSQGWKTFLRNHTDGIASCDFFIVPTIGFKLLYTFVVLGHGRRKLLHIGVTAHPTAEWAARQITEAFPWDTTPKTLIRDNDAIYGAVFKSKLKSMGIRDGPTALRSPWQNGHVERLIGSIRCECLDHMIIRDEDHLRKVLKAYVKYYNEVRTHLGLEKDAPHQRPVRRTGMIKSAPHLGGLHHEYVRI